MGRKRGIAATAVGQAACKQWIQQLAEDYPDEFCNSSVLSDHKSVALIESKIVPHLQLTSDESKSVLVDCRQHALVDSNLWVLDLHGDQLTSEIGIYEVRGLDPV